VAFSSSSAVFTIGAVTARVSMSSGAPPSTSPVAEGEAERTMPTPPSASRHQQEGEACATVVPHQVGPPATLCVQVFQGVFRHVASLYFSCFRCIFQVFYTDVAKVDRDVAYVAMVVHVCCKRLFPMFHFFRRMLQVCLFGCCICFHTYVPSVLSRCCVMFAMVFKYFCRCFRGMFQVFHLSFFVCCQCCI
jgi:hypothetical protein